MVNITYKTTLIGYFQELFNSVYAIDYQRHLSEDSSFIIADLKKSLYTLGKLIWLLENAQDFEISKEHLTEVNKLVIEIHYQLTCLMWLKIIKTQDYNSFIESLRMFMVILDSRPSVIK